MVKNVVLEAENGLEPVGRAKNEEIMRKIGKINHGWTRIDTDGKQPGEIQRKREQRTQKEREVMESAASPDAGQQPPLRSRRVLGVTGQLLG